VPAIPSWLLEPLWDQFAVRAYVSRLRRSLQADEGKRSPGLIESAGTGYVMRLPAGALDLDVFGRMAKEARAMGLPMIRRPDLLTALCAARPTNAIY
jgi:hypothetical protein